MNSALLAAAATAIAAAIIAPAAAYADNVDFGTNQAGCRAAEQQLHASGNSSADCFETGPGHYSLTYERRQAPSYRQSPAYVPPAASNLNALADALVSDIQGTVDANPDTAQAHIRVLRVNVWRTGASTFEAVATMAAAGHPPRDIPVHVFNSDTGPGWNISPEAMMSLVQ